LVAAILQPISASGNEALSIN